MWGEVSHDLKVSPQLPCGSMVASRVSEREGDRQDLSPPWTGPRPPLTCCGLLNCRDCQPALVSQCAGWGRPPPSNLRFSGGMAARGTEVDSDSPLVGEQARLGTAQFYSIYLFILPGLVSGEADPASLP